MSVAGIHRGVLKMYGGFIFKQWKKRFFMLTAGGSLLVSHHPSAPPNQLMLLQRSCEAIVAGKDIVDLPKLPSGGGRDCCFALILAQNKYLLLLAETPADCSQWLNVLRKVKQSLSSSCGSCRRYQEPPTHGNLCDLVPDQSSDKDQTSAPVSGRRSTSLGHVTLATPRENDLLLASPLNPTGRICPLPKYAQGGARSARCLRHGNLSNPEALKAVYLLMGGAAATSALSYLGTCTSSNLDARTPNLPVSADLSGSGPAGTYHSGNPAVHSPDFNTYDYDMADSDFDAFDCGGFTF